MRSTQPVATRQAPASAEEPRRALLSPARRDALFGILLRAVAVLVAALCVLVGVVLVVRSVPALQRFGMSFLWGTTWDPVQQVFGALPFLFGTVVTSVLALLLAVPLSVGTAIFLAEVAPRWLAAPISFAVELLAAIPSIVYGLWALFVLVPALQPVELWLSEHAGFIPLFRGAPYGVGMLAGALVLAIMVTPFITAVTRDVILAVPHSIREASYALGATRWETVVRGVLQYGRTGILGAVVLGLGRAMGETMAVTMVIGNTPQISASLFDPAYTMASVLANEFTEATYALYLSALIEIGLLLFVFTIVVNAAGRLLVLRTRGVAAGTGVVA